MGLACTNFQVGCLQELQAAGPPGGNGSCYCVQADVSIVHAQMRSVSWCRIWILQGGRGPLFKHCWSQACHTAGYANARAAGPGSCRHIGLCCNQSEQNWFPMYTGRGGTMWVLQLGTTELHMH